MSFSGDIKEELSKLKNLSNKEQVKAEILGYLITANISLLKNKVKFSTESQYNINRYGKLLSNLNSANYKIEINGKTYTVSNNKLSLEEVIYNNKIEINSTAMKSFLNNNEILEKAITRGSFLGSGSVNNPENKYHLEIIFNLKENAIFILDILRKYRIDFKILERKNNIFIYSKDGEEISKFLAFIGANTAVLKFEEIRVYRDIRNNVNRKVNCETANLNKTVNAAVKQINAINKLKEQGEFENLSENLKEIAKLRIENPDASLIELGKMLENPIGKSGVNHRLKAIEQIAEEGAKK